MKRILPDKGWFDPDAAECLSSVTGERLFITPSGNFIRQLLLPHESYVVLNDQQALLWLIGNNQEDSKNAYVVALLDSSEL